MTKTISVNKLNDIFIGDDGNISVSYGIDAVTQACEQAVKTQMGEMIFQTTQGIPNFETIWSSGRSAIPEFESALRSTILSVQDVSYIKSLDINFSEGNLTYMAVINTIYGEGTINNVL
jgi:hypothetical protein